MRVKDWMAAGLTPFVAVIVTGYVPPEPGAGVPASVAVPSPLSLNLTPRGSPPFSDKPGVGTPVVVTVRVPAWPTAKVVWSALVIPGAWLTVRVKLWVASGPTPFVAVIVNGYGPPVRSRCSRKCRRAVPVVGERDPRRQCARLGQCAVGHPGRRDGKGPGLADVKVVPAGLVIRHAWLTVRVKVWAAAGTTPFVALIVNGYVPPVFAAGVPEIVAVPSPLSVNVTPGGSVSGRGTMCSWAPRSS